VAVAEESEGGQVGGGVFAKATLFGAYLSACHMRWVSDCQPGFLGVIASVTGWTSPLRRKG
jgi:hypothetical protein